MKRLSVIAFAAFAAATAFCVPTWEAPLVRVSRVLGGAGGSVEESPVHAGYAWNADTALVARTSLDVGPKVAAATNEVYRRIFPVDPSVERLEGSFADAELTREFVYEVYMLGASRYVTSNATPGDPFPTYAALTNAVAVHSTNSPALFYNGRPFTPQKDDWCVVLSDESHPVATNQFPTTRWGWVGEFGAGGRFQYQVKLSDTAFTKEQYDAIDSTVTKDLVQWAWSMRTNDVAAITNDLWTSHLRLATNDFVTATNGLWTSHLRFATNDFVTATNCIWVEKRDLSDNRAVRSEGFTDWTVSPRPPFEPLVRYVEAAGSWQVLAPDSTPVAGIAASEDAVRVDFPEGHYDPSVFASPPSIVRHHVVTSNELFVTESYLSDATNRVVDRVETGLSLKRDLTDMVSVSTGGFSTNLVYRSERVAEILGRPLFIGATWKVAVRMAGESSSRLIMSDADPLASAIPFNDRDGSIALVYERRPLYATNDVFVTESFVTNYVRSLVSGVVAREFDKSSERTAVVMSGYPDGGGEVSEWDSSRGYVQGEQVVQYDDSGDKAVFVCVVDPWRATEAGLTWDQNVASNYWKMVSPAPRSVSEGVWTAVVGGPASAGSGPRGTGGHAEGAFSVTDGSYAHSEGSNTRASGESSHAEGARTHAMGRSAHAEGSSTVAAGEGSHAEGGFTAAAGRFSHAAGFAASTVGATNSPESCAWAWSGDEGRDPSEDPYRSHGNGTFNVNPVGGLSGFWVGETNLNDALSVKRDLTNSVASVSEGWTGWFVFPVPGFDYSVSYSGGQWSIVREGVPVATATAPEDASTVEFPDGTYDPSSFPSPPSMHRSHVVTSNEMYVTGSFVADATNRIWSALDGVGPTVSNVVQYSADVGSNFTAVVTAGRPTNDWIVAEWDPDTEYAQGMQVEVLGTNYVCIVFPWEPTVTGLTWEQNLASNYWKVVRTAPYSFSGGIWTAAVADLSDEDLPDGYAGHAEGSFTLTDARCAHAEGEYNRASGEAAHVEGIQSLAEGPVSHAEGEGTVALGEASHAEGGFTVAKGVFSHAAGFASIAGTTNRTDDYSWAWNGDESRNPYDSPYQSHGKGTFNVNPIGGLAGFFIGEKSLADCFPDPTRLVSTNGTRYVDAYGYAYETVPSVRWTANGNSFVQDGPSRWTYSPSPVAKNSLVYLSADSRWEFHMATRPDEASDWSDVTLGTTPGTGGEETVSVYFMTFVRETSDDFVPVERAVYTSPGLAGVTNMVSQDGLFVVGARGDVTEYLDESSYWDVPKYGEHLVQVGSNSWKYVASDYYSTLTFMDAGDGSGTWRYAWYQSDGTPSGDLEQVGHGADTTLFSGDDSMTRTVVPPGWRETKHVVFDAGFDPATNDLWYAIRNKRDARLLFSPDGLHCLDGDGAVHKYTPVHDDLYDADTGAQFSWYRVSYPWGGEETTWRMPSYRGDFSAYVVGWTNWDGSGEKWWIGEMYGEGDDAVYSMRNSSDDPFDAAVITIQVHEVPSDESTELITFHLSRYPQDEGFEQIGQILYAAKDDWGNIASYTIGERQWTSENGYNTFSIGYGNELYDSYCMAFGFYNTANSYYSLAMGGNAMATNNYSFVWSNGSGGKNGSHGDGTFNVYPSDGADGFWIGGRRLMDYVRDEGYRKYDDLTYFVTNAYDRLPETWDIKDASGNPQVSTRIYVQWGIYGNQSWGLMYNGNFSGGSSASARDRNATNVSFYNGWSASRAWEHIVETNANSTIVTFDLMGSAITNTITNAVPPAVAKALDDAQLRKVADNVCSNDTTFVGPWIVPLYAGDTSYVGPTYNGDNTWSLRVNQTSGYSTKTAIAGPDATYLGFYGGYGCTRTDYKARKGETFCTYESLTNWIGRLLDPRRPGGITPGGGATMAQVNAAISTYDADYVAPKLAVLDRNGGTTGVTLGGARAAAAAVGKDSLTAGNSNSAEATRSIAIGTMAKVLSPDKDTQAQNSIAIGTLVTVTNMYATAMGYNATAGHQKSFVWSGGTKYESKGTGTFAVNPTDGADGFYVGTDTLSATIKKKAGVTYVNGVEVETNDTWIDGKKIYAIAKELPVPAYGDYEATYAVGVPDGATIVEVKAIGKMKTGSWNPIPYVYAVGDDTWAGWYSSVHVDASGQLLFQFGTAFLDGSDGIAQLYATVRYTKP